MLHNNPLEPYFAKFPDRRPKLKQGSSALDRGYVATFEVKGASLFLKDIEIQRLDWGRKPDPLTWDSVFAQAWPAGETLKVDWFTGVLIMRYGNVVNYVHARYESTYENYILIEVDGGELTRSKRFDQKEYDSFRDAQFELFKKTDGYKQLIGDLKKRAYFEQKWADSYIRTRVVTYTPKFLD